MYIVVFLFFEWSYIHNLEMDLFFQTSAQSIIFRRLLILFCALALVAVITLYFVTGSCVERPFIKQVAAITVEQDTNDQPQLHPTKSNRHGIPELVKIEDDHRDKPYMRFLALNRTSDVQHNFKPIEDRGIEVHESDRPEVHKPIVDNQYSRVIFNATSCPLLQQDVPKIDVQMLSMYDRILFDDIDGGVWKQGWNIEYKEDQWNPKNKLKVFIVPHSHNDPGWIKTFENYYETQTSSIFSNMVYWLSLGFSRTFVWAEVSFLAIWWEKDASNDEKAMFLELINNKKIEIVTGGWVMNDEANSHWLSTIQELTLGHQWCIDNLGIAPKNAWSIDPFGYSSSQPYLLKLAGFKNSVVHRVHYAVKKELAFKKQLEFKWRQFWDGDGRTDIFTHMFPFFSYDIPHSCGPDPKDDGAEPVRAAALRSYLARRVGSGATLILDQWRKKAQLYRSNVLLFPLGDDARYESSNEWIYQLQNYDMLIKYINNNKSLNTEVQFSNLEDYFQALHAEVEMSKFPVLSGDFFTYADREQHYWSGYFTSRPFYKSMDRVLLAYLRAAETISSEAMTSRVLSRLMSSQLHNRVNNARRSLSLFQHHDAIGGTSATHVMKDYGKKMVTAITDCQAAIQQATHYLLKKPSVSEQTRDVIYFDESWRQHDEIPSKITILLNSAISSKKIALYNALMFTRHEILTIYVSSPYIQVFGPSGKPVIAQVSPAVISDKQLLFADYKYQISFPVVVKSLALAIYTVVLRKNSRVSRYTTYSRVRVYNANWTVDLPKLFPVKQSSAQLTEDVTVQATNSTKIISTPNGLIKAIVSTAETTIPVNMDFAQYDSQHGKNNNSGAYLFHPTGPASQLLPQSYPEIIIVEGVYRATLYTVHHIPKAADIALEFSVYNNPSLQQSEVKIKNTLLIDPEVTNLELSMRFSTDIQNGNMFHTDANGMHMIKRRNFPKLPIEANFYPLSAAAYIEDERFRLTLLTSTPLGVAALQSGQIEVMQDRRLSEDDSRGLGQGVLDNIKTLHTFKLIVEERHNVCSFKIPVEHPGGYLSLGAHISQQLVLQPLVIMHYTARDHTPYNGYSRVTINAANLVLASYQSHVTCKDNNGTIFHGMGVTFHRVHLDSCFGNKEIEQWYKQNDSQVLISDLVDAPIDGVYESTLTFTTLKQQLPDATVTLCPQQIRSVFITKTVKTLDSISHE